MGTSWVILNIILAVINSFMVCNLLGVLLDFLSTLGEELNK
jgi:hypothetical protein